MNHPDPPRDTREFTDYDQLAFDADNRRCNDEDVGELTASIAKVGQLQPGLVCKHPTEAGKWLVICGERRCRACKLAGVPFRAEVIDQVLSDVPRAVYRITENRHHKNMSAREQCAQYEIIQKGSGAKTYEELGAITGDSPAKICRIFCSRRIPDRLFPELNGIGVTIVQAIGGMESIANMEQAIAYLQAAKRTKDEMLEFIKRLEKRAGRERRLKNLSVNIGNRKITLEVASADNAEAVAKDLEALTRLFRKHLSAPPKAWPFVIKGDPPRDGPETRPPAGE